MLGTGVSIKSVKRVKLIVLPPPPPLPLLRIEMMLSCKSIPLVSKMSNLRYKRANSAIMKNVVILNIIHNIMS